MAELLPPIDPTTISEIEQNTISFKPGLKNDYFSDINDWNYYLKNSVGTVEINNNNLRITCPDADESIVVSHKEFVPNNDFQIVTDVSSYSPNDPLNSIIVFFGIDDTLDNPFPNYYGRNFALIQASYNGSGNPILSVSYKINGSASSSSTVNPSIFPIKLKLIREGTYIKTYYFESNTWNLIDSKDFDIYAYRLTTPRYQVDDSSSNGGYIDFDKFYIIPYDYYFPNDIFNNLDNFLITKNGSETADIDDGKFRNIIFDSATSQIVSLHKYSLPQGDFSLTIDIAEYTYNGGGYYGPFSVLKVSLNKSYIDTIYVLFYRDVSLYRLSYTYFINTARTDGPVTPVSLVGKLRITREGTYLKIYHYISSWLLLGSADFGSRAQNINTIELMSFSYNSIGGTIKYDNLILDNGVDSYNLYWKKNKIPNCYFHDLNDWLIYKNIGTEIAIIRNKRITLDIESGTSGRVNCAYNFDLPTEDYEIIIDLLNYQPDLASSGPWFTLGISDSGYVNVGMEIYTRYLSSAPYINSRYMTIGSWTYIGETFPSGFPLKLKIVRTGNIFQVWWYITSWTMTHSKDFSFYAQYLTRLNLIFETNSDNGNNGGSIEADNLIITPSVKSDYDGSINNIINLSYIHSLLDGNTIYCYEITSEGSESYASEETYGCTEEEIPIPNAPVISGISGDSENIITIPEVEDATIYNIYWSLSPGVTKENGTKISNVTSPHHHEYLIKQNYYYIATSENELYESDISNEICLQPLFEDKIFNHNEIMFERLLYQYMIKD